MRLFLPLLIALAVLAAFFRDDALLTLGYFVIAVIIVGGLWSRRAVHQLSCERELAPRAFIGDRLPMRLRLTNRSRLPIPWLTAEDGIPSELIFSAPTRAALWLAPREHTEFSAEIQPAKRGFYTLGPLRLRSGDLFGLGGEAAHHDGLSTLTVLPRIVPLRALGLPARAPLGALRHREPIFEDPSRPRGKRAYVRGDSPRKVDWKATAATGVLQSRLFEPSVSMDVVLALDLRETGYPERERYAASELGIVVAASMAAWASAAGQAVGLLCNGLDAAAGSRELASLLPRKGRPALTALLEALGRAQFAAGRELTTSRPLTRVLDEDAIHLPWGTALVVICGQVEDALLVRLRRLSEAGLNITVVLAARLPDDAFGALRARARRFGIEVWQAIDNNALFEVRA